MKKIFTKGFYIVSVIILFVGAVLPARAQLTSTNLETGLFYTALAKDASNNIYVIQVEPGTSGTQGELVKYTNGAGTGTVIYSGFHEGDNTGPGGDSPWGLVVNSTGDVYMTTDFSSVNGSIIKLTYNSGANTYAPSIFLEGSYYSSLAIDKNNNIYTTQYDPTGNGGSGSYAVYKYTPGGVGTLLYDNLKQAAGYSYPTGLAVDANLNVYVTDAYNEDGTVTDGGHVYELTAASGYAAALTVSSGHYASSLALDASGNLYTTENTGSTTAGYQLLKYTNGTGTPAVLYSPLHTDGVYYPWGIAVISSADIYVNDANDISGDGLGSVDGAVLQLIAAPTVQATNVTFTGTTTTSTTANWTNGNGSSRAVFISNSSTGSPAPVNGTSYTANAAYSSGTQIGASGWYCVYNGTGSTVNITGLSPGTTYRVMTVEYNGIGTFLTTAGTGNPANVNTVTSADLNIANTDNQSQYTPGTTLTYEIAVNNNGPNDVTGATVANTFPAGSTWTAVFAGGASGNASGSGSINETVNIPFNGSIVYTVTDPIPSSQTGGIEDISTVIVPAGVVDPNLANNEAEDVDTQNSIADLSITNTDGRATYIAGGTNTYTVVVSNTGPSDVTGAPYRQHMDSNVYRRCHRSSQRKWRY